MLILENFPVTRLSLKRKIILGLEPLMACIPLPRVDGLIISFPVICSPVKPSLHHRP